ncbi:2-dehydropantoate 2-reductase [Burkholderia sp. Leaf177]|uniref:2-dehydropantoate 2-reductase n=1 Tax=Burkholderia sp. Leaf177 TaxID=1736287 RepID=UPI000AB62912|nr:2-dehydropantoate 2-reductase [Burkholderia sp. Leaf177]
MNTQDTKITVVGGGAIGGVIAARLARAGVAVGLLARGAHLDAIKRNGLAVIEGEDRYVVNVDATDQPAALGVQDLLFICLKGPALTAAATSLKPLVGPGTHIVSVMNGVPWWYLNEFGGALAGQRLESVDPAGVVSEALPQSQASGCVVHISSAIAEPGVIKKGYGNELIIGPGSAQTAERATRAIELLRRAQFDVVASDNIRRDIWVKLWGNMTMNPISALTRSTGDMILDDPLTRSLVVSVMEEARRIGKEIGIELTMTTDARNAMTRKLGAFKTSMLQDVEAGRQLEIDAILGAPYEIGLKAGIPAPFISVLYGLAGQLNANLIKRA